MTYRKRAISLFCRKVLWNMSFAQLSEIASSCCPSAAPDCAQHQAHRGEIKANSVAGCPTVMHLAGKDLQNLRWFANVRTALSMRTSLCRTAAGSDLYLHVTTLPEITITVNLRFRLLAGSRDFDGRVVGHINPHMNMGIATVVPYKRRAFQSPCVPDAIFTNIIRLIE